MTDKPMVYPLPEAVDNKVNREWQIQPSQQFSARVYPKRSLLIVPLDGSPQSRMIRNHELGHIRWSPPKPEVAACRNKLDMDVLQAVEDMRINTKLAEIGVDTSSGSISQPVMKAFAVDLLKRGDLRGIILIMVAVIGQGANETVVREEFCEQSPADKAVQIADMARKIMWDKGTPRFKDTIRTAKWLQALLDSTAPVDPARLSKRLRLPKDDQECLERLLKMLGSFGTGRRATNKVPWGKMKVETPPRPRKVDGFLGKGRIASEEGVIPRYAHRLLVDGRVFCRTRRLADHEPRGRSAGGLEMAADAHELRVVANLHMRANGFNESTECPHRSAKLAHFGTANAHTGPQTGPLGENMLDDPLPPFVVY